MPTETVAALASEAKALIAAYHATPNTMILRTLAGVVVELRSHFRFEDGSIDWSGRSRSYRRVMGEAFELAGVPRAELNIIQTALRYHVRNLLRNGLFLDELERARLDSASPKERAARTGTAVKAGQRFVPTPDAIPAIAEYARSLLEYADDDVITALSPEEVEACRSSLAHIQARSAELFARLRGCTRY